MAWPKCPWPERPWPKRPTFLQVYNNIMQLLQKFNFSLNEFSELQSSKSVLRQFHIFESTIINNDLLISVLLLKG